MKGHRVHLFLVVVVCAVLLTPAFAQTAVPEPAGWYAGDMHVHRSCGYSPEAVSSMFSRMTPNNLAVESLLADMGNAEVQNATTDLPLVNGQDDPISTSGHILHWDTEWHWDATYTQYAHQALGGHIVALGLTNAHQIWQEYTFPILDWVHQQSGIAGFAHLQYLDGTGLPQSLTCCTSIEFPVEVALGAADFISEDVDDVTQNISNMYSEPPIQAYYKLLNSGFRPGLAAGTDYPCNGGGNLGGLLTYVQVAGGQLSYRNWVAGIANGRTVVSRNGHNEFLNLTVNSTSSPGDEIFLTGPGTVQVSVQWTATQNLSGTIELVQNGTVIASQSASAGPGAPATLTATVNVAKSGWLAARRMANNQHYVHTAAVFVTVNNAPVRASAADAQFFVNWTNGLIQNTNPGGQWNWYFPTSLAAAQARYQAAQSLYQQIAAEATGPAPTLTSIAITPANQTMASGTFQQYTATGTYSNGTTLNLTGQARWSSSVATVAAVSWRGVVAAANSGTTAISAALGSVSGSTNLTVQTIPLSITTATLANGAVGVSYSAGLAASGGLLPCTWSIVSSALPAGLSLNSSTGAITGTPTTAGTFTFTAQVTDVSTPHQNATKSFTIVIATSSGANCPCTIWSSSAIPGIADSGPDSSVEVGVKFHTDMAGYITGIRFYKGAGNTGTHVGNLWNTAGTRLATVTFSGETASGWQQANFSTPVAVTANTDYVASYLAPTGHYADDSGYFGSAVDNAPLHALADGTDGANGVYAYGSPSSFPSSGYQSSNYWVDVVFTTGTNTTPPTVASVYPANGATAVSPTTTVSATFSEAIDPTTINANTFQVLGPGNAPVTGTVTYSSTSATATFLPGAALATSTTYTGVITGGSGGVKDLAGNALVSNFTWSFTTSASAPPPGSCPCTIWGPSAVPTNIDSSDSSAVELGVRFRSDVPGTITGLRFYKASTNTGTHTGHIWTNSGTLLGTATFSGESSSGWQTASFTSPVTIAPNTTYVASYFAPAGHYSDSVNFFAGSGVDNAPLHALQTGVDGVNGAYSYGSASSFPASTYSATNYWVDVVFTPTSSTTPPTIKAVTPANNSTGTSLGPAVSAVFGEPMTASSINSTTFVLLDPSNTPVAANVAYNAATSTATLTPTVELAPSATYTATIRSGASGVKDFNNNAMASDYTWSFATGAAPANSGPGGPILVISNALNPFSRYYGEILSAEGMNEYTVSDLSNLTPAVLGNYDVVILGDMSLTSAQVSMLSNWVNGGGNLIAMHPDKQMAGMLGLTATASTLSNAYLLVQNSTGPGVGIVGQTIQFHGPADLYSLSGASSVANLYSNASTATAFPAITLATAGAGQAAAFTYDLARSIVYTRQGNPAWSGQPRDGQAGPIRSDDLYYGAASFDPEPDWVDFNKISIPQADEQQRLLANLILQMNALRKPLPRFWYFPSNAKAVVVMTGDDHGSYYSGSATSARFSDFQAASPSGCSVPDWQCVRATSYVFPQALASNPLSNSQVSSYTSQGFEVSIHVDSNPTCADWSTGELDTQYTSLLASLASQFPSLPAPKTHRMHCIGWSDYDSQPAVELKHGIRMDTSYYYWPSNWINDQPGLFTGSGMPMRFTDRNGSIIDVYQATTQMTDESGQSYPLNIDTILDNALGTSGFYGAFVVQAHDDQGSYPGIAPDVVASAQSRGVPIVSSLQLLTWLDGRNSSSFGSLAWSGNTLSFSIVKGTGVRNLIALLPLYGPTGTLSSITLGGSAVAFTTQTIKGVSYATFNAVAGNYLAVYGGGSATVALSSVSVNPATVSGGSGSTGTLSLNAPAPTGGATVILSSSNPSVAQAAVPSVVVAAGSTSATFAITTTAVASTTQVNISGTYPSGTTQSAVLTVSPTATVSSVSLNPASVLGSNSSTGTVTLSGPAPSGGAVVTLSSNNASVATVAASVTVPAGSSSATFAVATSPVATATTVAIMATYGTSTGNATLTVTAPAPSSVTLNPSAVTGGTSSTGTVTLTGAAPAGGASVSLASSNTTAAQVPASVVVAAGSTTATFTITTASVTAVTTVSITATYGGNASATLTVNPALAVSAVALNPTSVVGGNNSTGTVTLNAAAPAGGSVVALASNNTAAATVPASVTVPAGSTSTTFTVTTLGVSSTNTAVITATLGGNATATLTVTAASLSSVTRSPSSVVGGNNSTGTVTLNGKAPATGAVVTLSSSNTSVAQVPASVTIAAGATSASFTITTTPVSANTNVTISATYGVTRTTTLTVNALALSSITRSPSSVVGGNNSTGTVTLNGRAPAGGVVVTLASNNVSAAQVPASVPIAAGATSASFTISTNGVASTTSVTLTGVYGTTRTTTLTVSVASLTSLTLSPSTLTGGSSSTGTLTLNGAAPPIGAVVALSSNNIVAAQVPTSATVPPGAMSITFTVTTGAVHGTSASISGTYRGATRSAALTVQ